MREKQLIHEREHNWSLERSIIATAHIDYIKDLLIDVLRQTFTQHPEYTYVERQIGSDEGVIGTEPDFDRTRIVITDVYTYSVKFLPAITVRVNSSNAIDVSFSQNRGTIDYLHNDLGGIVYDEHGHPIPVYYEYSGAWESQVTVNVAAEDTLSREELVAFLSVGLFHLKRDELYTKGIFVKNVSVGGETEEPYANDYIYKQPITLTIWSEWTHRLPLVGASLDILSIDSDGMNWSNEEEDTTVSMWLVRSNGDWVIKTEWIEWWQDQFNVANAGHLLSYNEYDGQPIPFYVALINVNNIYGKSLRQFENEVEDLRQTLTDVTQIAQLNTIEKK